MKETDLIERLRQWPSLDPKLMHAAADEIDALRARLAEAERQNADVQAEVYRLVAGEESGWVCGDEHAVVVQERDWARARLAEAEAANELLRRVKSSDDLAYEHVVEMYHAEAAENERQAGLVVRLTEAADNAVHEWAFVGHGDSYEAAMDALAAVLAEVEETP